MLKKFISSQHFNAILTVKFCPCVKLILHETIRNDDFWRNTALQCWNSAETIRNNAATMLQRCVALKIAVANRLV